MNKNQHIIYKEITGKNEFRRNQKDEIYKGLISNIDVLIYAKPEYNFQKMKFIRKCLLKNLDYSDYINKHFNSNQYKQMNLGLDPLFTESANDVNPIVMNGISTGTSNHDFFSQVGNGYLIGQVEATQDSDYNMGLN